MSKSLWKGYISFGLVAIPVSIVPVEQKKELHFHLLDARDKSRINYKRVNSESGKEVPWDQIVKGYEYDKGNYVILNDEDFERASPEAFKTIDIEEFVDIKEIDSLYFDKPYYLLPEGKNKKAYVLLREALRTTQKVGVAKVIIRTKEYLSLIMPHHDALVINLIRFQQEMVDEASLTFPDEKLKSYKIVDREMKMAVDLIKEMSGKWKPEKYHDEYQEKLMEWIENKISSGKRVKVKTPSLGTKKSDEVVDFMTLLKNSLKNKKGSKNTRKTQ
jgi:DNA end-binding protein Ku